MHDLIQTPKHWRVIGILLGTMLLVNWTGAHACEGADRDKTIDLIYDSLDFGFKCGMNIERCDLSGMGKLAERHDQLPQSCQALLKQVSDAFAPKFGGGGTQCVGGVCCDTTSCYGG